VSHSDRPLLEVDDLKVYFPITKGLVLRRRIGEVRAVDGVSLEIWRGQTVGLVGESGSGKSTFARAVVGLYRPTAGQIVFDGQDIGTLDRDELRRVRRRFQMVFQDPLASLDPRMTVGASIVEPLEIHGVGTRTERRARVGELLGLVGLHARLADRYPHELSGGQRQRVGVARALSLHPDLVVADEPVSALDVSIQAQIINLLRRLQRHLGLTYIVIAHDLAVVRHVSDVIAVMYLGRIAEWAEAAELYREPLHPYTVALLSAVPIPDPAVEATRQRIVLRGDVPNPAAPPSGCPFHSRCWLREALGKPEICSSEVPPLRTVRSGHRVACHFAEETTGRSDRAVARVPDPDVPAASNERSG
jgi:oligopeptide/dipeptide ABC transporter ATP-binding protein